MCVSVDNRLQVSCVLVDEGQEKTDDGTDDDSQLFMFGTDQDFSMYTRTHPSDMVNTFLRDIASSWHAPVHPSVYTSFYYTYNFT